MESERAVALDKDEEPYRRAQAHDQCSTDSGRIQSSRVCHQWQNANDCQYEDDYPAGSEVPAIYSSHHNPCIVITVYRVGNPLH